MNENEQDQVIVDEVEETNEEVEEVAEEKPAKAEKPKRTPQEEYDYHKGRAERLAKKLGLKDEKPEVKATPTDKPSDLDFGQKAYLKSYGIAGSDELSLVRQFQDRGFSLDSIVEDDVFTAKLNSLREARQVANAVPKGQRRSSQGSVDNLDLAWAKYKESGELPKDFELRSKVIDKITEEERGPMFSIK